MQQLNVPTASVSKKVVLLILDGWGVTEDYEGNAITKANPEFFNYLLEKLSKYITASIRKCRWFAMG